MAAALLAGCDEDRAPEGQPSPTPHASATPAGSPTPAPGSFDGRVSQPGLALGITEPNPALYWSPVKRPQIAEPFATWRTALGATRPAVYRLMVRWRPLEPTPGALNLAAPEAGCLRHKLPCAGWGGVVEQLAALASRQQHDGGWEGMLTIWDVPEWAAAPRSPCEPPDTDPWSRGLSRDAIPAYRRLVRALAQEADRQNARIRWWSAWNEPNHPYFVAEQRRPCDDRASTPAAARYVDLVRAMDAELRDAPGAERILGELAGLDQTTPYKTSVRQFIRALPRDVVCASRVWSQHSYVHGPETVDAAARALADHDCPAPHRIWITETGRGTPDEALSGGGARAAGEAACRSLHRALTEFHADPRVDLAIQYTFREDDRFRVGLASTDLTRPLPALEAWMAWSLRAGPESPPPRSPC